jgi:hypothetical protein
MGVVQDPVAGLPALLRPWRGALAALLIVGGAVALANTPSLGLLDVDTQPIQGPPDPVSFRHSDHVAPPEPSRAAVRRGADELAPSHAGWSVPASPLNLIAAELVPDWATEPATVAADTTTEESTDIPEFVSIRSPVGALADLSSGRSFDSANSLGNLVGGGGSGAGGAIGGQRRQTSSMPNPAPDPADPTSATAPSDDPVQPVLNTPLATGPVPEPATWMTMILGLGLMGAMLRSSRRPRLA